MTEREHPPVPNYWWVGWRDARTACISQEGNINRSFPSNFKLFPKNTVQEVLELILKILIDHIFNPALGVGNWGKGSWATKAITPGGQTMSL